MPRQLRIEYPGAIYHVMNRGDRREEIFKEDQDREQFLETPGERLPQDGNDGIVEQPVVSVAQGNAGVKAQEQASEQYQEL